MISAITGDILNSYRSALNYSIPILIRDNGLRFDDLDSTDFPICKSANKFRTTEIQRTIERCGERAAKVIHACRPYQGGDRNLWLLSELNNLDKHRALATVGNVYIGHSEGEFAASKTRENWSRQHPGQVFPHNSNARQFVSSPQPSKILKEGDILKSFSDGELNNDPHFMFEIAFNETGLVRGRIVLDLIGDIKRSVGGVIAKLWTG
jgi:hypothetical protein